MSDIRSTPAFHFIVKHSNKYYLTHELWEFDPAVDDTNLNDDQKYWLEQVASLYDNTAEKAEGAAFVTHVKVAKATELDGEERPIGDS